MNILFSSTELSFVSTQADLQEHASIRHQLTLEEVLPSAMLAREDRLKQPTNFATMGSQTGACVGCAACGECGGCGGGLLDGCRSVLCTMEFATNHRKMCSPCHKWYHNNGLVRVHSATCFNTRANHCRFRCQRRAGGETGEKSDSCNRTTALRTTIGILEKSSSVGGKQKGPLRLNSYPFPTPFALVLDAIRCCYLLQRRRQHCQLVGVCPGDVWLPGARSGRLSAADSDARCVSRYATSDALARNRARLLL